MLYIVHADTNEVIRVLNSKQKVLDFIKKDLYKGLGWEITTVDKEYPIDTVSAELFISENG